MSNPYFPLPPATLAPAAHAQWLGRLQEAERISGLREAGGPLVSSETLALLQRYVQDELSLAQVVRLQSQRLPRK
ncbi:hypothetical protein ACW9KT_22175 [Hymenobacter sp. HD11105]